MASLLLHRIDKCITENRIIDKAARGFQAARNSDLYVKVYV